MNINGGPTLTVYGSWSNGVSSSAFSGGTVVLAGATPATVWGGNTWSNLTITTTNKVVSFQTNAIQYIYGIPAFSNNVTLQSTSNSVWWYLRKVGAGTQDVGVVQVQDSNATNGWTFRAKAGSVNKGHNVNWIFTPASGTLIMMR